jgi:hypothetical protein
MEKEVGQQGQVWRCDEAWPAPVRGKHINHELHGISTPKVSQPVPVNFPRSKSL